MEHRRTIPQDPPPRLSAMAAALASPTPSLLAALIRSRVKSEHQVPTTVALPWGVARDHRPNLPRVGRAALSLYMGRRAVDSYPLIFTALALAHPN